MEPIILPRISDQKPLVSVVSITYNHEPYIRDCLEGFLMQKTDFPFEIIIHDDASTDHTADIIREYYEKRPDLFHVIIERENQYSQNKSVSIPLFEQARGNYIAFCEGDDYWTDPLKLQKQYDFMTKKEDYIACVHRYNVIDKNNNLSAIETFAEYSDEQSGDFTLKDYENQARLPSHLNTLFFKNIFMSNDKKTKYILSSKQTPTGDTKLFISLLIHGKFYRMKEIMSNYRYVREANGNSWTSRQIGKDPYLVWHEWNNLSHCLKEQGYNINLDNKKLTFEFAIIKQFFKHPSLRSAKNAASFFFKQKGSLSYFIKRIYVKIKNSFIGKREQNQIEKDANN